MSRRTRNVWVSLVGVMTCVGGVLLLMDESRAGKAEGFTVPTAMATSTAGGSSSIFNTSKPIDEARWTRIVVVQTGGPFASGESLAAESQSRGETGGPAYHFVVGNGNGLGDGVVHVGRRWVWQDDSSSGAGTIVVGVVGSARRGPHTEAQTVRLVNLVNQLMTRFSISGDRVFLDVGAGFPSARFVEQVAGR
ncbi:MAG: N-acetylmuramoyl-L-alanine amidase [Phycisphaeraceae bacterium]|nr:MAG: N-acetylmuramoyl-L-alanine amidase [Phycisphaeraceae bacterium]